MEKATLASDTTLQIEKEIIRDLWVYLKEHRDPPMPGTEESNRFWKQAVLDLRDIIAVKWGNHPLAMKVGPAIYEYISSERIGGPPDDVLGRR